MRLEEIAAMEAMEEAQPEPKPQSEPQSELPAELPADPKLEDLSHLPTVALSEAAQAQNYETEVEFRDEDTFKFICGTAGTGKTFAVKAHKEAHPSRIQLCATTGIAAVNLGGDATTINAALGFFNTEALLSKSTSGGLDSSFKWWARLGKTHWIVDEVSMMDAMQLSAFVFAVEQVNEDLANVKDYDIARYGKVRFTLVGDFAQLPPVDGEFAFTADEWDRFEANTTMLTKIRRQTDIDFVTALQLLRRGAGAEALGYLRDRIVMNRHLEFNGTTLMGKNRDVDRYNKIKLTALKAEKFVYQKSKWGKQRSEWEKNIPDTIELKQGALVMILANVRHVCGVGFEYVNGDLGNIVDFDADTCWVKLHRDNRTVGVTFIHREVEELVEKVSKSGKTVKREREVVGWINYMPIRLAYASTIHKSQGLTLDEVQICFGDRFVGEPGMLYVALSRARTMQGLRLVGNPDVFPMRCKADEKVRRWL